MEYGYHRAGATISAGSADPGSAAFKRAFSNATNSLSAGFNRQADPVQNPQLTTMERLFSKNYAPPAINSQALQRDAGKAVTDLPMMKEQTATLRSQVDIQKGALAKDLQSAQAEARQHLEAAGKARGHDFSDITHTLRPNTDTSLIHAGVTLAVAKATAGMGTFATAASNAASVVEVSKDEARKLKPGELRSVLEDARNAAIHAQERKAITTDYSAKAPTQPKQDFQWDQISAEEFSEIATARVEDLTDFQRLSYAEEELDLIEENHIYVEEHYDDTITADKLAAKQEAGTLQLTSAEIEMHTGALKDLGGLRLSKPVEIDPETEKALAARHDHEPDPLKLGIDPHKSSIGFSAA